MQRQKEKVLDKNSIIPAYYQLYKMLEKKIRKREFRPGEHLPTEMELASQFDISRITVRRAIAELVAAGMVYTQQGRGTFVAMPRLDNYTFDLNNFYNEISQKKIRLHEELLEATIIKADELLARRLGTAVNTRCLYFRDIISANDEPLVYEAKYMVYTKQAPILESELKDPSLPNLVTIHSNTTPASSKDILMVSKSNKEESDALGIKVGTPVFLMTQTIYDGDNKIIAWGKSIYRGDRYKIINCQGWNIK